MFPVPSWRKIYVRFLCTLALACFVTATSAYAQTAPSRTYDVELMVPKEKKTVETDADITFEQTTFRVVPDKESYKGETRQIAYSDIKQADHSFSKKPMLSGGGAIVPQAQAQDSSRRGISPLSSSWNVEITAENRQALRSGRPARDMPARVAAIRGGSSPAVAG